MSATICDSSAVDNYLSQLSSRESERTRRLTIENNKREIPFTIMKFGLVFLMREKEHLKGIIIMKIIIILIDHNIRDNRVENFQYSTFRNIMDQVFLKGVQ